MVLQTQKRCQFFAVEFSDAFSDLVGEDEFEERLLLLVEVNADGGTGDGGSLFSGDWWQRPGDVGEDIEEVALFGVDDLLHFRELFVAEAFFRQSFQQFLACIGGAPD